MVKQNSRKLALMVVALVLCSAPHAFSQDSSGRAAFARPSPSPRKTFRIQVEVSEGSERVERAKVILTSEEAGVSFSKDGNTNKQGTLSASGVPQGKLRIQVIAKDCDTFGQVFTLSEENQTFRISVTKRAPTPSP